MGTEKGSENELPFIHRFTSQIPMCNQVEAKNLRLQPPPWVADTHAFEPSPTVSQKAEIRSGASVNYPGPLTRDRGSQKMSYLLCQIPSPQSPFIYGH